MWQFIRGVEGIRDAALALKTPVISGNVSFYNETEGHAIPPTPTIAMVGRLDDVSRRVTQFFKRPGDRDRAGADRAAVACGERVCVAVRRDRRRRVSAAIDLAREKSLIEALVAAAGPGVDKLRSRRVRGRPGGGARGSLFQSASGFGR